MIADSLVAAAIGAAIFYYSNGILVFPPLQEISINDIVGFLPSFLIIATILAALTVVGYIGAILESKCILKMYILTMAVFITANIHAVRKFFQNIDYVQDIVDKLLGNMFNDADMREKFTVLEYIFICCGSTGPGAYDEIGLSIPLGCCEILDNNNQCPKEYANVGCSYKLGRAMLLLAYGAGFFMVLMIALEVVAVIFSVIARNYIKNKKR